MLLNEKYLNYCLIIILPIVSLFLLFNRNFGVKNKKELSNKKLYILSFIIGLFLGAYDGFFGPGTGTFLVICFTGILGFNLITASGNAKIVNLASNFSALIAYILGRKVMFSIGVPAAVCAIAGNYLGAHLAIKNGDKIIKPIIFVAIGLLFIKVIFDLI